jgi:trimeric autotransporter adhesin
MEIMMEKIFHKTMLKLIFAICILLLLTCSSILGQSTQINIDGIPMQNGDTMSICPGTVLEFFVDHNYTNPGISWVFPNGTPTSSQQQNVNVHFNLPDKLDSVSVVVTHTSGKDTAWVFIEVYKSITAPYILSSQTICYNTSPSVLKVYNNTPSGGDGVFNYQWQDSVVGRNWTNLPGANSDTIKPGNLIINTWYRLLANGNACGDVISNTLKITVYDSIIPPELSQAQLICYDTSPDTLHITPAQGADGDFNYTWLNSTDSTDWNPVQSGGLSFTPPQLKDTTWYKVLSKATSCNPQTIKYSNIIRIDVRPETKPPSLQHDTTICYNTVPGTFTRTDASGADEIFDYYWQFKYPKGHINNFVNIGGGSTSITPAQPLIDTAYYRVRAYNKICDYTLYSDTITVLVWKNIVLPVVTLDANDRNICYNSSPNKALTRTDATGADGVFIYDWIYKNDSTVNWVGTGSSGITYKPAALTRKTFYAVAVSNSTCSKQDSSNVVNISVGADTVGPEINFGDTIICYDTKPDKLIITQKAQGGFETIYYTWQDSLDGGSWDSITNPSATDTVYQPDNLKKTTWFRVKSTENFCKDTLYSNEVKITVREPIVAGVISPASVELCYNDSVTLSINPIGGDSIFTYLWKKKPNNGIWINISNDSNQLQSGPLWDSINYRVVVKSGCTTYNNKSDSSDIFIDVADEFKSGKISINNGDTIICYGRSPDTMSIKNVKGGRKPYSFDWQRKGTAGKWMPVGTDSTFNDTTRLTDTTYYRVIVSTVMDCGLDTLFQTISVLPEIIRPEIKNQDDSICTNKIPANITLVDTASGADGNFAYQWQSSIDHGINFPDIVDSIKTSYKPTATLSKDTWYRVRAVNGICVDTIYSDTLKLSIYTVLNAGKISPDTSHLCFNDSVTLKLDSTSGGKQSYTYLWFKRLDTSPNWDSISNSNTQSLNTGNLQTSMYYKVEVKDACTTAKQTDSIFVDVAPEFKIGKIIIDMDTIDTDTICFGTSPDTFTASGFSGGRKPYTYIWKRKDSIGNWDTVQIGNDSIFMDSISLFTDTLYQLTVISDSDCGQDSILITVYVNPLPAADSTKILGLDSVCQNANGIFYELDLPGFDSLYYYSWSISNGEIVQNKSTAVVDFGKTGTEIITVVISDGKTECQRIINKPVKINKNEAPPTISITKKNDLDILTCDTAGKGSLYQWGYFEKGIYDDNLLGGNDTIRYVQIPGFDTSKNVYFVIVSLNGCLSRSYYLGFPVGIETLSSISSPFRLYPNPTTGMVNIEGPIHKIKQLWVTDLTGKQIDIRWEGKNQIELPGYLSGGYYLVSFATKTGFFHHAIILIR